MRRKLIQHGLSSLTVSLPRKWVQRHNLKKGDDIELEESDSKIVISSGKLRGSRSIAVDVSNAQQMIRRIIGAAYKSGHDEIEITFKSYEELVAIQNLVREQFTGFGITSQTKNRIVLKNLLQTNFEEFPNALRRFFHILNHMASEFCNALNQNDYQWLRNTTLLKIESDKFADYCRRAINMGGEIGFKRAAPLYTMIEQLEKVVDRYRDACEYVASRKLKTSKTLKSSAQDITALLQKFQTLSFSFSLAGMIEFGRQKEVIQRVLDQAAARCAREEVKLVMLLDRILNIIFDLNGPLMAVNL